MKLLHVTTVPTTLYFLRGQSSRLLEEGIEVSLLSSPGPELEEFAQLEGAAAIGLPMTREISPVADLTALVRLIRILRQVRPDILHVHTPKAGLLATVAGRLAGVPVCIYQVLGLRYMTATGIRRRLLTTVERVACALAHHVLFLTPSLLTIAEDEHLIRRGKGKVIGSGSLNGVDTEAFRRDLFEGDADEVRGGLGIPAGSPVVGFIGRLVADKGVAELTTAWRRISVMHPEAHLLVVGAPEENDPVDTRTMSFLKEDPKVHLVGFRSDVRPLVAAMSILVLPSHREGMGHVLLEASAMGVATVGSDIPGIRDAITDGETGLLFPLRDAVALTDRLSRLLSDPGLRAELGRAGRLRVVHEFDMRHVREQFLDYYLEVASAAGRAEPGTDTTSRLAERSAP